MREDRFTPHGRLWHGAAYYPELWPGLGIDEELLRIREAGLNVVRIGEFAWSKMEPAPGEFDFSFFIDVLDRVEALGLKAVFGTPTATPPVWLTHGHPERCLHDINGRPMVHGGRQHLAVDEPFVRERCRRIVEELAMAIGRHPALMAWQIDNEFKCDVDADYGPSAVPRWEEWLRQRYENIENLNTQWGTGVWSQEYHAFEQVPIPVKCPGLHNASLLTAWQRFTRDRILDFCRMQLKVIRGHSSAPVTHNTAMLFKVDTDKLTQCLDFVSFDHYVDCTNVGQMIMNYDYWRNTGKDRRFWLMETSASHNGSLLGFHKAHPPGFVRAEAVAAYALGATAFCYWVWRQQRSGAELTHGCLMQSWDSPAVGMKAALEVDAARKELEIALKGRDLIRAEVGITWSDTARIMMDVEPHNGLNYANLIMDSSKALRSRGLHLDILPESADLDHLKVLYTPFMPALPTPFFERLRDFVHKGGVWIAGPLTGGRTVEHTVPLNAGLGDLEEIAGIRTLHSYPLSGTGTYGSGFGMRVELVGWSHVFESAGAQIIGVLEGGSTPGMGFLSEHSVGKGKIVVLGSQIHDDAADLFLQTMVTHYADLQGVKARYLVSAGTLVAEWRNQEDTLWVVVNIDGQGGTLKLPPLHEVSMGGKCIDAEIIEVSPYQHVCLTLTPKRMDSVRKNV